MPKERCVAPAGSAGVVNDFEAQLVEAADVGLVVHETHDPVLER
jgi:hypothetical protein